MNCSIMSGQSGKYRMWVFFMFILTISPGKALQLNKTQIDRQISLFSTDLADFFEKVLGAKKLQKIYDAGKNTKYIPMESKNVLQHQLHNDLRKELLLVENSLDVLKKQLEGSHTQRHKMPTVQDCSTFNGPWSYSAKFRQGIHWKSCLLDRKQQEIDNVIQEQEHFLKESVENSSSASWHYIVTEKDLYQFPIGQQQNTSVKQASEFSRCLLAASHFGSAHRNMAIVIAVANITIWEAVINTLENVLETLFDADKVALFLVNGTNVVSLHGCGNQTLETNRYNIDVIKNKLRNVHGLPEVVKSADVSEAVNLAFQALNTSSTVEQGSLPIYQNALLFITSGIEEGATEVVKAMEQGQDQLATPAYLFLYGLDNSTLSSLATKGLKTVVLDIYENLADYYTYLPPSVLPPGQDYIYFGPHYDSSVGMTFTIGAPFSTENGTKGVVAIDVSVATLFRPVLGSQLGAKSYAFVVDRRTGNVIAHPRLPLPSELLTAIPTLYVTDIEPQLPKSLLQDLYRGHSRINVTGKARRHVPDDVHEELISERALFSISPLEKSPFAIILVLVDGDTRRDYNDYHYQPKPEAYYYRYDILDNMGRDPTLCNSAGIPVAKHQSVIKLSPNVFCDPFYPWRKESRTHAEFVQTFLRTGRNGTFLRDPTTAKAILVDTYRSDELVSTWREHDQLPVQRYLGTRNGVARLYPGQLLDGGFDPREQQWYRNAARFSQITVVSSEPSLIGPPTDRSRLLSVSKAIYEERSGISRHSRLDPVSAVVGADVSVHLLQSLLLEKAKACCFPVSSGPSYQLVLNTSSLYQVNGGCQQFVLQRILDTNMYLLVVLGNSTCPPSPKQRETKECRSSELLCKESGSASLCSDFDGITSFTSLCPVTSRSKTIDVKPTVAVPGVPSCPRSCAEVQGQEACTAMSSCIWTSHLRYPVCVPSTEANFTVSPPQPTPKILTTRSPTPTPTLRPSRAPSPGVPTLRPGASTLKPGVPTLRPGASTLKPGGPTLRPGVSTNQTGALQQGTTGSPVNMTTEENGAGLNDEWLAWSNKTLAIVGSVIGGIVVLSILIGIFLKWVGWEFKLPTRESTAKLTSSKFDNPVYETDSEEDSLAGSMVSTQHRGYREF
ncbi:VWFA and cache domain-containing protein 1 [Lingula anatina]|uniref:VWFA and cache domain-containing protein 1 n=1 Tax=Lingula anatina TaxID=7574 RepID=A0A1S3H3G7_LINAN|nr:VWFA and cache domain-containing protein 1 [Lingula anatina]|eukprot:XP_013380680.1 VWFA and cache domain-containing protein 1 [Lingula anatina]